MSALRKGTVAAPVVCIARVAARLLRSLLGSLHYSLDVLARPLPHRASHTSKQLVSFLAAAGLISTTRDLR